MLTDSSMPPSDDLALQGLCRKGKRRSKWQQAIREKAITIALRGCAAFSIMTTALIIGMLSYESVRFLREVSIVEFLTSFKWSPMLGNTADFARELLVRQCECAWKLRHPKVALRLCEKAAHMQPQSDPAAQGLKWAKAVRRTLPLAPIV